MVNLLNLLLLAATATTGGLPLRVAPGSGMYAPVAPPALVRAGMVLAVSLSGPVRVRAASGASTSGRSADDGVEGSTQAPIGSFLKSVKRAIPWVAGFLLVGALAAVVATCWLRKGILTQNLSTGSGRTGAGKRPVNRKAAAEYLAQVEQRQAAKREAESRHGTDAKAP